MGCKYIKSKNYNNVINKQNTVIQNKKENITEKNKELKSIEKQKIFNKLCTEINFKTYLINFPASIGEIELPIYIKKKEKIKIKIINEKSEWSFINDNKINYKGYNSIYYDNNNLGCIICRISSYKNKYYIINKEFSFESQEEGSILLSCNLDLDNVSNYQLKGFMELEIIGGELMNINMLYQKLGYNIQIPKEINLNDENEITLFRYINMVRMQPYQFCKNYIDYFEENEEIIKFMKDLAPIPQLKISIQLTEIAQEHNKYLCENGTIGHNEMNKLSLKERIDKLDKNFYDFGENIFYGINNPLLIVIKMLIDQFSNEKKNRRNIINSNFQEIGISLKEHLIYQFSCFLLFGRKS